MARVTVEDCAEVVPNRFELVAIASQRARSISSGNPITIERDNDKDPVISLREIAERTIDVEKLREALIQSCQERVQLDGYGVEAADNIENADSEVLAEIHDLQQSIAATEHSLLYGEDNLDVED